MKNRLKVLRAERDWSQQDLATFFGFPKNFGVATHISAWAAVPIRAAVLGLGHFYNKARGI